MTEIKIARVYDAPAEGTRVLVDRLWPRGVGKEDAPFDEWLQQVAPSTNLRIWYGHRREHFADFRTRYAHELQAPESREAMAHLRDLARTGNLTLLTAAKELEISHAAVLADVLTKESGSEAA